MSKKMSRKKRAANILGYAVSDSDAGYRVYRGVTTEREARARYADEQRGLEKRNLLWKREPRFWPLTRLPK